MRKKENSIANKAKEENKKSSSIKRVFHYVKNILGCVIIVLLAFLLISFLLVRVSGGTPTIFGHTIQRIASGSMEPELQVGDIILSKTVSSPDEISAGDIITFKGGAQFSQNNVTHRVVVAPHETINGDYTLITKGDANEIADDEITFESVQSKMSCKIELLKYLFDFFLSPWGLIIFIGALLFIFFDELLNVVRIVSGNYSDEEEESIAEIMERIQREDREKEEEKKRLEEKKSKDMVQVMTEAEPEKDTDENAEDKTDEASE